ncbi:MAG: hypothetical protein CMP11_03830 [Zetaproteobacteria bacterium]|nr:hypothetical protein [Pseudobdellovibrionaceae bacterium]
MLKNKITYLSLLLITSVYSSHILNAKPIKKKYGVTQNGKMPSQTLSAVSSNVIQVQGVMTDEHYEDVVNDPQKARNDEERLAGLSAREIFILVDRSGSMKASDDNPTGSYEKSWTRWDSARVASESIAELALSLDPDSKVDIMLWDGDEYSRLNHKYEVMTEVGEISSFFHKNPPQRGTTPLAEALDELYNKHLKELLNKSEPFTVVVLTDGAPNDPAKVKKFFKKIIQENNLEKKERQTLAAFSFVRMGDDPGAIRFIEDLDDNLISQMDLGVDIVDTKEDNFLFGTGNYAKKEGVGPFALFWDALYD